MTRSADEGRTLRARAQDRWHAWRAARCATPTGFALAPEPRSIGDVGRGRDLLRGKAVFGGQLVPLSPDRPWQVPVSDAAMLRDVEGFVWLDDLAAVGDPAARALAQRWVWGWLARNRRGQGPGWRPALAGQRLIRCIHHAVFLLQDRAPPEADAFFRSLAHHADYLGRRAHAAPAGVPRLDALTGLLYAGLSLEHEAGRIHPALQALTAACREDVDAEGTLASRVPEELLAVFTRLTWVLLLLREAQRDVPPEITQTLDRIAPTLRSLRHANGDLARFHGGGPGGMGMLDLALAEAGSRDLPRDQAMGYARLAAGRTTVIVDAAPPPIGRGAGHASTLAFELTSGRRPLIVNCGDGATFGEAWQRAARATPSHSTLALDGFSSARLAPRSRASPLSAAPLVEGPCNVPVRLDRTPAGTTVVASHDGYLASHGLIHTRHLALSHDGRSLEGEDRLRAESAAARARFRACGTDDTDHGLVFHIRFHLHPDAVPRLLPEDDAVVIDLPSGESWLFGHDGRARMRVEASVYLEPGRVQPRATKQVVLTHRAISYATRLKWSLGKTAQSATIPRDFARETIDFDET